MITIIDSPLAATSPWRNLTEELNHWGAKGRIATLWWRDDDAASPCRPLEELLSAADGVPVALAVIPAVAASALAIWLEEQAPAQVYVLQHGWRHVNHSAVGKKSEFPTSRARHLAAADLRAGRERITELFGPRALAVLVPPWNSYDPALLPLLVKTGLRAISTIKPREAVYPLAGIFASNVHVDFVAWRGARGFVGSSVALGGLTAHLRARRCGSVDAGEPTGILTHHLVHDNATRAFLTELISLTRAHPATRWLTAAEVFGPAAGPTTGAA